MIENCSQRETAQQLGLMLPSSSLANPKVGQYPSPSSTTREQNSHLSPHPPVQDKAPPPTPPLVKAGIRVAGTAGSWSGLNKHSLVESWPSPYGDLDGKFVTDLFDEPEVLHPETTDFLGWHSEEGHVPYQSVGVVQEGSEPHEEAEARWADDPCWRMPYGQDRVYSGSFVPEAPDDDPLDRDGPYSWEAQQMWRVNRLLSGKFPRVPMSPASALLKAERKHAKALFHGPGDGRRDLVREVVYRRQCASLRPGGCRECQARLVKTASQVAKLEAAENARWDREALLQRYYRRDLHLVDQGLIPFASVTPPKYDANDVLQYFRPVVPAPGPPVSPQGAQSQLFGVAPPRDVTRDIGRSGRGRGRGRVRWNR